MKKLALVLLTLILLAACGTAAPEEEPVADTADEISEYETNAEDEDFSIEA